MCPNSCSAAAAARCEVYCSDYTCGSPQRPEDLPSLRNLIRYKSDYDPTNPKKFVGCCVDTSAVTDFEKGGMTVNLDTFGAQDHLCWDTSSMTNMYQAFFYEANFNGVVTSWDTSRVTNMQDVFGYVTSFNQPLVWDTSKVTNMAYMFKNDPNHCPEGACSFNQPLYWDVSNVKEMREMVTAAPSPPPPLHALSHRLSALPPTRSSKVRPRHARRT